MPAKVKKSTQVTPEKFNALRGADRKLLQEFFGLSDEDIKEVNKEIVYEGESGQHSYAQRSFELSDKAKSSLGSVTKHYTHLPKGMRTNVYTDASGNQIGHGKVWKSQSGFEKAAPLLGLAAMFIPGMQGFAGSIGSALGASGAGASALGGAVIGGTTSKLTGGDFLKGAIGGAIGGIPSAGSAIGRAMGLTGNAAKIVGSGVVNAGTSAAMGARGGDILRAGLGGSAGAGIGSFGASQGWNPAVTSGLGRLGSSLVRGVPANQALVSALLRTLAPGKS